MKLINSYSNRTAWPLVFCLLLCSFMQVQAQNFANSDLDGTPFGYSNLPAGWETVPVGDPVSVASNTNIGDTPDLTNLSQPGIDDGVGGIAFSGSSFISGLRMSSAVNFHEGIQQTVSGFQVGQNYTIEFYQAVVKQVFALDNTGSWSVYMDTDLLGVSAISTSTLNFDDINLEWELRSVDFIASAASHTFKFLPTDDDFNDSSSLTDEQAGLRMGIDQISIIQNEIIDCDLDLGEDVTVCFTELPLTIGTELEGTYEWDTGAETASIEVTESGTYTLEVNSECGVLIDSITIQVDNAIPEVNLGEDIFICEYEFPVNLEISETGVDIEWSTGAETPAINVTTAGNYSVEISNVCGVSSTSVSIIVTPNSLQEESLVLCQGQSIDFLGQTFDQEGAYELIVPSELEGGCDVFWNVTINVIEQDTIFEFLQIGESGIATYEGTTFEQEGLFFLTETSEDGCESVVVVSVENYPEVFVYVPSAFTPDSNGLNELFHPVITLEGNVQLLDFAGR